MKLILLVLFLVQSFIPVQVLAIKQVRIDNIECNYDHCDEDSSEAGFQIQEWEDELDEDDVTAASNNHFDNKLQLLGIVFIENFVGLHPSSTSIPPEK